MSSLRIGSAAIVAAVVTFLATPPARAEGDDADIRKQALALNDVTGDETIKRRVQALVEDSASTKKLLVYAAKMAKEAKEKEQPFNFNGAYILARAAQLLKDPDNSERFYRICTDEALKLKSGHKLGLAFGGLIDLLYENKKYAECEKVCQEFLELDGDKTIENLKLFVLYSQIQALARQDKIDQATKLADNLIKITSGNWRFVRVKGFVQREAGDYDAAIKTYEEVIEKIQKEKDLPKEDKDEEVALNRYILSSIFVDANKIDKAAEQLKTLLAEDQNNPTYNNDLGYIWADHDMNLDEAEKLIRKAIDEERKLRQKQQPDLKPEEIKSNAAYVDSLGWVLFKKKKYKEAEAYLLEAVKDPDDGQHLEIYDHLGDVHLALGEKAEAIAAWKKAVQLVSPSKRDQQRKAEVEKKIKDNGK